MTKKILITGGAGFIASNFVKYIFRNYADYQVTVLDALTYAGNTDNLPESIKKDSRFSFWYGNVRNGELVNELVSKCDTVIHFAAETHVARSIFDNGIFFETDVIGTQVMANSILKNAGCIDRFVHISTSEVYGSALQIPMSEDHPLNPTTPYAAAKAGADRLVYSYWQTYDIPAIIIRPFNAYGPNQHLEKAIPRFITSALINEPLTIHGNGGNTRDWNYVDDLCVAFDKAIHTSIDKVKGQVINLGTGHDTSVKQIAEIILNKLDKPDSFITYTEERPGQVLRHYSSTEKAEQLLGWKAATSLERGLEQTIIWYEQNPDWWKKQLWMRHVAIKNKDGKVEYY